MSKFYSINSIVDDLLRTIRNSNISASEDISRVQLEMWVHNYRALLLKQFIDKNGYANPDYVQEIAAIELEQVDFGEGTTLEVGKYRFKTTIDIPTTVDIEGGTGIVSVQDMEGNEIQVIPQVRSFLHKYRKWSKRDTVAYYTNGRIYIDTCNLQKYIKIRGVFEVPSDLNSINNPLTNLPCYDSDSKFPVPASIVPVIKQMIMERELSITIQMPTDTKNNSNNAVADKIQ